MVQTQQKLSALSRAKVNLTLDVLKRRPDGYHNLASVMQSIDLADTLHIAITSGTGIKITTDVASIPSGPSNTVYKACALFKDAAELDCGVVVQIEKRIPIEAGLGGGSSNAGAALLALNEMFDGILVPDDLSAIAARVGSDVPYFLIGGTALVLSRGETVEKIADAPEMNVVIAKPDLGVSTSWAYGRLAAVPGRKSLSGTKAMVDAVESGDAARVVAGLCNDFDETVCEAFAPIADLKKTLVKLGAHAAMLCGSGAGVFGVFEDAKTARKAAASIGKTCPFVVATKTYPSAVTLGDLDGD